MISLADLMEALENRPTGAVWEQLVSIVDGEPVEEQNANALRIIRRWLLELASAEVVDDAEDYVGMIDEYLKELDPYIR